MPKSRHASAAGQLPLSLIDHPACGSLACGEAIATALSDGIARSGKSRARVAVEMSDYLGTTITVAQLNAWTATSKAGHRFPAEYLGAFSFSTGDSSALELLARQAGVHLVGARAMARLEVQDLDEQMRLLRVRKRELLSVANVREAGR